MRYFLIGWITTLLFISCKNSEIPDVSSIKVNLKTERFESDFFSMDTTRLAASLQTLNQKYPEFLPAFIQNILGLDMDSVLQGGEESGVVKMFIRDYQPLKDSSDALYSNFDNQMKSIREGLQFVKYYFHNYKIPESVITFIGPINASFSTSFGVQGDVITSRSFGIGLQLHLGENSSFYRSAEGLEQYPAYISRNFDPAHIPVNCMKNIVDDLYPEQSVSQPLLEQMVDKGRRLFLLSKFLPRTSEYLLIGYTKKQMKASYENEGIIWDLFLNNDLLNKTDPAIVKNYIGESPKTQELGEDAPGNLGSFAGWQIVKKFMEKYPQTTVAELMKANARDIYTRAKYKPRI